ncbi:MAG: alpha/beta hydrolase [Candidatus Binatia bacterium]|nr:MAG: alpha/beta hydrolase [Candidatus Binatia bacterium]
MPFFSHRSARLYYEVHGPPLGEATVLVWAHGAGGNHLSWWQQIPEFSKRYTCVTFDHRGFGLSREDERSPGGAAFVGDLQALLDHLGVDKAVLVGQSMGGWTSLGFAVQHPQRVQALVLTDTHGGLTSEAISSAWARAFHRLKEGSFSYHPAAGARMARDQPWKYFLYLQISGLNSEHSVEELGELLAAAASPTPEDIRKVECPVLLVWGEEDEVIPLEVGRVAASYFARGQIQTIPEAGHSAYFERPEKFNSVIWDFLRATIG